MLQRVDTENDRAIYKGWVAEPGHQATRIAEPVFLDPTIDSDIRKYHPTSTVNSEIFAFKHVLVQEPPQGQGENQGEPQYFVVVTEISDTWDRKLYRIMSALRFNAVLNRDGEIDYLLDDRRHEDLAMDGWVVTRWEVHKKRNLTTKVVHLDVVTWEKEGRSAVSCFGWNPYVDRNQIALTSVGSSLI